MTNVTRLGTKRAHVAPAQRYKRSRSYLGACVMLDLAAKIRKEYPRLDTTELEALSPEFYTLTNSYLDDVFRTLDETYREYADAK